MTGFLAWAALALMLSLLLGVIRVLRGPSPADRLMAAQLIEREWGQVLTYSRAGSQAKE